MRVADELADDESSALAGSDDQHIPRALGDAEVPDPALDHQVNRESGADQQRERQQHEQDDHAGGQGDAGALPDHRVHQRDHADDRQGRDDRALGQRFVVALADVTPEPLVGAKSCEDDKNERHGPDDRRRQQVLIAHGAPGGHPVKAKPEGEQVGEGDQDSVHHDLRQGMAVDWKGRGPDPSAHAAGFYLRSR